MKDECFKSTPTGYLDPEAQDIPIFSAIDSYIKNYERISSDHLESYANHGVNPFMAEDFWVECEDSTAKLIESYTPKDGKVLDVGCGMARLLSRVPQFSRYGMDISSGYLKVASETGVKLCLAKVEEMPFVDGFFDTVVCTDVLEHVLDLNVAVKQLFRVTKSGGKLIIRVPYRENLSLYLNPEYPYDLAHLRNFDEHGITLLCEKVFGQQVEYIEFGPYIIDPGFLKFTVQGRGVGFLFRLFFRVLRLFPETIFKAAVVRILKPVEFQIVVSVTH